MPDSQIWTNCLLTHDENSIQFPPKYFKKSIKLTCALTVSKHTKTITFLITLEVLKGFWKKKLDIFNKVRKSLENHWKHYFGSHWDIFENSGHDKMNVSGI